MKLDGNTILINGRKVEEMVRVSLKGLADDRFEIRLGHSNQLKLVSRLAPGFILSQLSKPVARMLAN